MASESPDIKGDLCNYLQVVGSGKFAACEPLRNASNPGLFVDGIGKIGLPLSERDAADLIRASHEAPFGMGSETFVDPKVRKIWELNPNQFELRNPAWPSTLHEVVNKVAQELGVVDGASSISAELHKMLLYEPGAFFDKHRDTEKAPGMFATLVIALPSEHTGGDVIVRLRDEEQTLKTQGTCDFGYSYLAWYADVNHSVSKVESGYRFVLTYNLIRPASNPSRVASALDDHKQNLDKALALWSKQDREYESHSDYVYNKMVYILEHEYSEANIRLDQLKGKDQLRMRYLWEACQDQSFCLFFAHFEYSQVGSVDEDENGPSGAEFHEFIDELEKKWELLSVFQSDGKQIGENIALEKEELLENIDFEGIEPDDEECDGWTGNEGCTATHFYHRTCAVILPRHHRLDVLSEAGKVNVKEYISTLLIEMQNKKLSMASHEELKKLCEMIIDAKKTPLKMRKNSREASYDAGWRREEPDVKGLSRVSDKALTFVCEAILRLHSPDLLEQVASVTSRILSLDLFQKLGEYLVESDIGLWRNGIKIAMSRIPTISERVKALDLLVSNYQKAAPNNVAATQGVQELEHEMAMSVTENQGRDVSVTAADAQALMQLSDKYGEQYTFQVVLPLVKKHTSNLEFVAEFLKGLSQAGEANKLRVEVVQNLYKDILADVIPDLHLHYRETQGEQPQNEFAKRRRLDYYGHGSQAAEELSPRSVTAENLVMLFQSCGKFGLFHEIEQLSDKIVSLCPRVNLMIFEHILLPLLRQLLPPVEPGSTTMGTRGYPKLFRSVLTSYINTYVQLPPSKPTGSEREPHGCGLNCQDCLLLSAFVQNPDRPRANFWFKVKYRATHLEERLKQSSCSTETTKSGSRWTVVVKKKGMAYEIAMKEWKQRCKVAYRAVEGIGFEKLRGLLGVDWEEFVGLTGVKKAIGEEMGERRPLWELVQGRGMNGAVESRDGNKLAERVGAEIIDLSGE